MFSRIAKNYDLVNRVISGGQDVGWRRSAARECVGGKDALKVLDGATGTGDIAIILTEEAERQGKHIEVVGLDFNSDMLRIAKRKTARRGIKNIRYVLGDALHMRLKSGQFDAITTGFALRNFDDLQQFMNESFRVLKPGGKMVFLDVAKPEPILRKAFELYYNTVIPIVGGIYNRDAYHWLVSSLWRFDKDKAVGMARAAGFEHVHIRNLTFGAAFILIGTKPIGKRSRD